MKGASPLTISFKERKLPNAIQLDIQVKRVVSIKIDKEIAEKIDEKTKSEGYLNRSDYIRNLIVNYIQSNSVDESVRGITDILTKKCDTIITFRLDNSLVEKLDELAKQKGFSTRSDLLRYIIYSFIRS